MKKNAIRLAVAMLFSLLVSPSLAADLPTAMHGVENLYSATVSPLLTGADLVPLVDCGPQFTLFADANSFRAAIPSTAIGWVNLQYLTDPRVIPGSDKVYQFFVVFREDPNGSQDGYHVYQPCVTRNVSR